MNMEPYDVYRSYLALKLHFTTEKYNIIEQKGRIRASRQAFFKRSDLFNIKKLASSYSDNEIINFLVANFVSGDKWGGVFDSDARSNYLSWKKRIESITYILERELDKISFDAEKNNLDFNDYFVSTNLQLPKVINLYLRNDVSIETLVIINKINNFVELVDSKLQDDIVWPDISRLIKKYSPFLNINKQKYDDIIRRRFRSD
jgi:hypothetical protein